MDAADRGPLRASQSYSLSLCVAMIVRPSILKRTAILMVLCDFR